MKFKTNLYQLREERQISPRAFAHLVSATLYGKRFGPYFTEPVIAGLDPTDGNKPFICSMDLIGCINFAKDFVVSGTASSNLYGVCEALYEPDLVPWGDYLLAYMFNRSRRSCLRRCRRP